MKPNNNYLRDEVRNYYKADQLPVVNIHDFKVAKELNVTEITRRATKEVNLLEAATSGSGVSGLLIGGVTALLIFLLFLILVLV